MKTPKSKEIVRAVVKHCCGHEQERELPYSTSKPYYETRECNACYFQSRLDPNAKSKFDSLNLPELKALSKTQLSYGEQCRIACVDVIADLLATPVDTDTQKDSLRICKEVIFNNDAGHWISIKTPERLLSKIKAQLSRHRRIEINTTAIKNLIQLGVDVKPTTTEDEFPSPEPVEPKTNQ